MPTPEEAGLNSDYRRCVQSLEESWGGIDNATEQVPWYLNITIFQYFLFASASLTLKHILFLFFSGRSFGGGFGGVLKIISSPDCAF